MTWCTVAVFPPPGTPEMYRQPPGLGVAVDRVVVGDRVAVVGWQWRAWIGKVIASILSGDKAYIGWKLVVYGVFFFFFFFFVVILVFLYMSGSGSGDRVAVVGWQWRAWIGEVMGSILSGDKLWIGWKLVFDSWLVYRILTIDIKIGQKRHLGGF
jgi:hypothetical protein